MRDLMCAEGMAEGGGRRAAGGAAGGVRRPPILSALPLSNSFPKISNHPHTTPKFKNE
jgi:hypothetical protein